MKNKQELDEIRWQIQASLSQSKRDELRDKFGMPAEYTSPQLSSEEEISFLDDVLQFERQFENAPRITVRERIGNPTLQPFTEISPYEMEDAVDDLLELLFEHNIVIDFMGEWSAFAAYRFITETLLDEEMDDIRIEDMYVHFDFDAITPEYDIQMWVERFVLDMFTHEREYFLPGLDKQPLFDMTGEPITAVQFRNQIEKVWQYLPATNQCSIEPIVVQVEGNEGAVTAVIIWHNNKNEAIGQVESYFRLQPSPYTGWDVVQTSLLDDLLQFFEA